MPNVRKDADMFIRYNKVSLQDSYVQITGEEEDSFISVSGQRETIDDYEIGDQKVVRVYFRMDPITDLYERQIFSSGDLLAQVGGYFSFLHVLGAALVYIFSERLLISSLAAKLYQVYDDKKENKYDNDDSGDGMREVNQSLNRSSNKIHNISVDDEESNFFKMNPVRNLIK